MNEEGILMIISGPSGSGKGTVVNELTKDGDFSLSISATTRAPRPGEEDGVHYFFKTKDQFKELIDNNELLEWAQFCDNFYGTPIRYVESQMKAGKNVILEIEVQGALQVKEKYPSTVLVFLIPPTIDELRKRLTGRGTESEDVIEKRIKRAADELELMERYDYVVVNNTIEKAKEDILEIVAAEKMSVKRNQNIKKIFKGEIL